MTRNEALDFMRGLEKKDIRLIVTLRPMSETNAVMITGKQILPYNEFLDAFETLTGYRPEDKETSRGFNTKNCYFLFPKPLVHKPKIHEPLGQRSPLTHQFGEPRPIKLNVANDRPVDEAIKAFAVIVRDERLNYIDYSTGEQRESRAERSSINPLLGRLREPWMRMKIRLRRDADYKTWRLEFDDPDLQEAHPDAAALLTQYKEGLEALYRTHISYRRHYIPKLTFDYDGERGILTLRSDPSEPKPEHDREDAAYCMAMFLAHPEKGNVNFPGSSKVFPRARSKDSEV